MHYIKSKLHQLIRSYSKKFSYTFFNCMIQTSLKMKYYQKILLKSTPLNELLPLSILLLNKDVHLSLQKVTIADNFVKCVLNFFNNFQSCIELERSVFQRFMSIFGCNILVKMQWNLCGNFENIVSDPNSTTQNVVISKILSKLKIRICQEDFGSCFQIYFHTYILQFLQSRNSQKSSTSRVYSTFP